MAVILERLARPHDGKPLRERVDDREKRGRGTHGRTKKESGRKKITSREADSRRASGRIAATKKRTGRKKTTRKNAPMKPRKGKREKPPCLMVRERAGAKKSSKEKRCVTRRHDHDHQVAIGSFYSWFPGGDLRDHRLRRKEEKRGLKAAPFSN